MSMPKVRDYDPDNDALYDNDYGNNKRKRTNRLEGLEGKSKSGNKSRDKRNKKETHRVYEEVKDEFEGY